MQRGLCEGAFVSWLMLQQAEDLDDMATLAHLFRIIRGAIMLNEAALLEELLKVLKSGMPSRHQCCVRTRQQ
jgi:hypothetical protein